MRHSQERPFRLGMVYIVMLILYALLVISFYFLAGKELHIRDSRGDLDLPVAETAAGELAQGVVIEQVFQADIQRFQTVSVQWTTYMRANAGIVTVELYDLRNQSLLASQTLDAAAMTEGMVTTLSIDPPSETLYGAPLLLRLSADSVSGSAVSPLMSSSADEDGCTLYINGVETFGSLCFSATGEDYIWTGLHYWEFAAGFGAVLLAGLAWSYWRWRTGRHSFLANAFLAVKKYRFLIKQLVSRDFKTKYKRSILGVFWSFLNPLLTMCVQYFVFSTIFKNDIENFAVYLLIGVVLFNFFSEACGMALTSILGNAGLITKVYVPKYIYPLTRVMSSMVNLAISLIPLLIVCLVTGVHFHKSAVLALYFIVCLVIFCLGLGLLLATSMVFFRDTQFLWGVLTMVWMYATPIFYPETILPQEFRFVLNINPLYHFLRSMRMCILDGISPEPFVYVQCFGIALAMLLIGALIFKIKQDRFVLYL